MKKEFNYNENLDKIIKQLPNGAFLVVKHKDERNIMTIGWATFGFIWKKPILMVAVRETRHTHNLISRAKDFTLNIPIEKDLSKELDFCGTYSGKNMDKAKECRLNFANSNKVLSPIIKECDYHYECKILFSQPMDLKNLDSTVKAEYYEKDDHHILYFGEIVDSYKI